MTASGLAPAAARGRRRTSPRVALLLLGGACLLAGLDAALLLVGVWAPLKATHLPGVHGMVMVLGFMGSLIALERAQALRSGWAHLAPAVLGAGGIALAAGLPALLGQLLLVEGCLLFIAVHLALWRRAPLPVAAVQLLSVVLATAAAALWLVTDVDSLLPLLAAFLVLTIAAERAELAQLAMGRRAMPALVWIACWLAATAAAALIWHDVGARLFGLGVLGTAIWLVRDDVPRRMLGTTTGLRRYNAAALLGGYGWLAVAGLTWLIGGTPVGGPYDVVIHATFLGFGVSMIMAHAPIILPAVLGRALPYHPVLWLPLGVLNAAMVARVVGDLISVRVLWEVGSVATVLAILLFAATAAVLAVRS